MTADIIPFHDQDRSIVDVSGGGREKPYRVWLRGKVWAEFATMSNAARAASALMTLEALGMLDCVSAPEVVVRDMLAASVAELGGGDAA